MAKLNFKKGTTSKVVRIFAQNSSTGAPMTGLAYNSSGLVAYYMKGNDTTVTAITLVSGTLGTWSSGGFKEVDSVKMPGVYELGIPDAAIASGKSCLIYMSGVANLVPILIELQLEEVDNQDPLAYGLTRIDAATSSRATSSDITAALTAQGLTATRAAFLDVLNGLVTNIWGNASRTLTAGTRDNEIDEILTLANAIRGKTDMIGTGSAIAQTPVPNYGPVRIVKGFDYKEKDGMEHLLNQHIPVPVLATIDISYAISFDLVVGETVLSTGSPVGAGTDSQIVKFDLAAAVTSTLPGGPQKWRVRGNFPGPTEVDLAEVTVCVEE